MTPEKHTPLTSAEMAHLWTTYMGNSLAFRVLQYFTAKVEDPEIRPVLEQAFTLSRTAVEQLNRLFKQVHFPIPFGFTAEDVDVEAPRLYSDHFMLLYVKNMGFTGMSAVSAALNVCTRTDVVMFFQEALHGSNQLHDKASRVMLSKGLYIKAPSLPTPEQVEFVEKQSFLAGWFGDRRTLHMPEITHVFVNIQNNMLSKTLLTGFSQGAQSEKVRQFLLRGVDLASKHVEIFGSLLSEDDIPAPVVGDVGVSQSRIQPLSDKLMMFHTHVLFAGKIGHYGLALSLTTRRDVSSHYVRLMAEMGHYAEDGVKIMIENGWLEQPPKAPDRLRLAES